VSGVLAAGAIGAPPPRVVAVEDPLGHLMTTAHRATVPSSTAVAAPGGAGGAVRPAPAPPAPPSPPTIKGALPVGKGMWLYLPDRVEGGNVDALVARAKAVGLTHVYVRTGSSKDGFNAREYLDRLLPAAHAAGIRVYAWDFPYLDNWQDDVTRALAAIYYATPGGHRVDGFSADIELRSMGVNLTPLTALAYGANLRRQVGANYPLIATVPRPSSRLVGYPFAEVVTYFDAIAPMVYWMGDEPGDAAATSLAALRGFGKPLLPVGQAYDGGPEGGPAGVPSAAQIQRFMHVSEEAGATGVSFWSWQHASQEAWDAIRDAPQFRLSAAPDPPSIGQVRAYQVLLNSLGFPVGIDGVWGPNTAAAVASYQRAARLPVTGAIDAATRALLLTPFTPPLP
jgi:hypothetical protein